MEQLLREMSVLRPTFHREFMRYLKIWLFSEPISGGISLESSGVMRYSTILVRKVFLIISFMKSNVVT